MKKMTCKDMGGPCDAEFTAETPKEMIDAGMRHVKQAHPEMAKDIEKMSKKELKDWNDMFMEKWKVAPAVK